LLWAVEGCYLLWAVEGCYLLWAVEGCYLWSFAVLCMLVLQATLGGGGCYTGGGLKSRRRLIWEEKGAEVPGAWGGKEEGTGEKEVGKRRGKVGRRILWDTHIGINLAIGVAVTWPVTNHHRSSTKKEEGSCQQREEKQLQPLEHLV